MTDPAPHRLTIQPSSPGLHRFILDGVFDVTQYIQEALMDLCPDGSQRLYLELVEGELPADCHIEIIAWRQSNGHIT